MSLEQDLQKVEMTIEQAKERVHLGELLDKLSMVPEFKELIEERYLKDYAVRLVELKAVPNMDQADVEDRLKAISHLNQYFMFVSREANEAKEALEAYEQDRVEILQEIGAEEEF